MGDLRWRGSGRGTLGGLPVLAHTYQDKAGGRVVLLLADRRSRPRVGAHHPAGSDTWISDVEGVVLFCADRPAPSAGGWAGPHPGLVAAARLDLS